MHKNHFETFKKAKKFARSLNLDNRRSWLQYSMSGKKPTNIPATPYLIYKNKGWISWGDWLGTGEIASKNREFLPFKKALKFVRSLDLNNFVEWRQFCTSEKMPIDVPSNPNKLYKDKGWISWGHWLGTKNISPQKRTFKPFKRARIFARSLKLHSQSAWKLYSKSGSRPEDIPAAPHKVYLDKGWISWGDWLGTGNIATQSVKAK